MTKQFDTTIYRWTHGKEPKGRRVWAFASDRAPEDGQVVTVRGTFDEAKRTAARLPEFAGVSVVHVLP